MTPEQLVPTCQLCQQLVDAGIVIDTHFVWVIGLGIDKKLHWFCVERTLQNKDRLKEQFACWDAFPAPTAEEFWDYLKNMNYAVFSFVENQSGVSLVMNVFPSGFERVDSQTLASALAELAIKVKEV